MLKLVSVAEEAGLNLNWAEIQKAHISHGVDHMGLDARKPIFRGLQTTQAQASLCICAD